MKKMECGFLPYYRAFLRSEKRPYFKAFGSESVTFIIILALTFLSFTTKTPPDGSVAVNAITLVYLFSAFIWGAAAVFGGAIREKPTLVSVIPVKNTVKPFYNALGLLISAVIAFAIYIAAILCITGIPLLLSGIAFNLWVHIVDYFEFLGGLGVSLSVYGVLYLIFYVVYNFGGALMYSNIRNKKVRIVFTVCFAVVTEGYFLLINNLSNGESGFVFRSLAVENFGNLPLPWLWITAFAAIACGLTAFAMFIAFKQSKISKI